MTGDEFGRLLQDFTRAAESGDGSRFAAFFTEDAVYHDYIYGPHTGRAEIGRMLQELFQWITPQYWMFWIGLVLVVIVLVGRHRIHAYALWLPNLVLRQIAGRKAAVALTDNEAP